MWNSIRRYFSAQTEEIASDYVLRAYGVALALIIPLTFYFWKGLIVQSVNTPVPYCWPFWPSCELHPLRIIGEAGLKAYWAVTVAAAISAAALFFTGRVRSAFFFLCAAFLLKGFQQTASYSFMGNYHYMPYVVVGAFALAPGKRIVIPVLIFLFYFYAGMLKLNMEWLSGAAIPGSISWMPEPHFQTALFAVILLELGFSWGLLSARKTIRAACLVMFIIFHIISWEIVGYFYPTVMALLLSIFVFELLPGSRQRPVLSSVPKPGAAFVAIFVLAQLIPALSGKDPAIHTYWRISSLNMFDAATECQGGIYIRKDAETIEYIPEFHRSFGIRVRCDPILFMSEAYALCRENHWDNTFRNIDVVLSAKRATGDRFEPVLRENNICRKGGG